MTASKRGQKYGLITCHNGDVFMYEVEGEFNAFKKALYDTMLDTYYAGGYNSIENFKSSVEQLGIKFRRL